MSVIFFCLVLSNYSWNVTNFCWKLVQAIFINKQLIFQKTIMWDIVVWVDTARIFNKIIFSSHHGKRWAQFRNFYSTVKTDNTLTLRFSWFFQDFFNGHLVESCCRFNESGRIKRTAHMACKISGIKNSLVVLDSVSVWHQRFIIDIHTLMLTLNSHNIYYLLCIYQGNREEIEIKLYGNLN